MPESDGSARYKSLLLKKLSLQSTPKAFTAGGVVVRQLAAFA